MAELTRGAFLPPPVQYRVLPDPVQNRVKVIPVFARLEKIKGPIRLQKCEILSFHWITETVQFEVIIVRPNFHVNISEQFTIREWMRPS